MKMNDTPIVAFLIPFASRGVERFYFLQLNDPIPWDENHAVGLKLDKSANFGAARSYAKPTWNPSYVIKLYADDLIGSKLVLWLENTCGEAGYLLKSGSLWRSGSLSCSIQGSHACSTLRRAALLHREVCDSL